MLISDAMPPAAGGPDHFELMGRRVSRVDGRLQLEDGTLAGSALTMDEALRYCVDQLGIGLADALRMASLVPATFCGGSTISAGSRRDIWRASCTSTTRCRCGRLGSRGGSGA